MRGLAAFVGPTIIATYFPFCAATVRPTVAPERARGRLAELWHEPDDLPAADLFYGPWGKERAPDPTLIYTFVKDKTHGISPGLTVRDSRGTRWSVKQGEEGPIEVTLSRVLSAIGYHQPPVYFLPSFAVGRKDWIARAPGGRFRPTLKGVREDGSWSWQQNPFVGARPYQGLLVVLMVFDSSDLKNSNNSMFRLDEEREGATRWFVVRDIGTALGETGRLNPTRGDPAVFGRQRFITRVKNGHVEFDYRGWHQELFGRITPADVRWACELLARLSDEQWAEAFRAGGYKPEVADRFIRVIKRRIDEGRQVRER